MIYALLSLISAYWGLTAGVGATTLLRPLIEAVSPLNPASVALQCTMAALGSALVCAFFALNRPLPLHQDELILLAAGAAVGGILGDLAFARFSAMISAGGVTLLQNALLFTLIALPAVYFRTLAQSVRPLALTRLCAFPAALLTGLIAAFLAFGAEPLTLMLYYLLFDAEDDEASAAALTVALFSMAGKLVVQLFRLRMNLPDAEILLWLLPGALLGALLAIFPAIRQRFQTGSGLLMQFCLYTSLVNMVSSLL